MEVSLHDDLILGSRFGVFFFAGGAIPNPLDIRFQKVGGLSAEVKTTTVNGRTIEEKIFRSEGTPV